MTLFARQSLTSHRQPRPTGYWVALSVLAMASALFIAWTGVGVLTALVLLALFAVLVVRPPENMTEKWLISAPLWVLALGAVVAALVLLRPPTMPSIQSYLIHVGLRVAVNNSAAPDDFAAQRGKRAENRTPRLSPGLMRDVVATAAVKGEWLRKTGTANSANVILWMHSGNYVAGHPASTRPIAMDMANKTNTPVFSLQYRLAPENPYPAALEDVNAAYAWLLQAGYHPDAIIVGGESAGAGLAIALVQSLKQKGAALPAGIIAISPWVDLRGTAPSMTTRADQDAMQSPAYLSAAAKAYGRDDLDNPLISPLYGDFTGFPPLMLQEGDESILVDDTLRLAEKAKSQGVDVTLQVWPGAPHRMTSLFMFLPEGRRSLDDVEAWVRDRFALNNAAAP